MFAVGKSSVQGHAILADCRGEAEGILIKNKKAKSCTNGKIAKHFPLWNTIANHGAQYPISRFVLVRNLRSYLYQALIRTWIPNVLFLQRARLQKLINGSIQNVSLSGEKGGNDDTVLSSLAVSP